MMEGYKVLRKDNGVVVEDWRRSNMPKDTLRSSYQNLCALSNDITDRMAQGNCPSQFLNDSLALVTFGRDLIRKRYGITRGGERLYGNFMRTAERLYLFIDGELKQRMGQG